MKISAIIAICPTLGTPTVLRLRLRIGIRLCEQEKNDTDHGKHSEGSILAVPGLRLPHQKPFTTHGQESRQPHHQGEREGGYRNSFGLHKHICRRGERPR